MHPNIYFAPSLIQVKALENKNIVKVAAGQFYSVALDSHGKVYALVAATKVSLKSILECPIKQKFILGLSSHSRKLSSFQGTSEF